MDKFKEAVVVTLILLGLSSKVFAVAWTVEVEDVRVWSSIKPKYLPQTPVTLIQQVAIGIVIIILSLLVTLLQIRCFQLH